MAVRTHPRRPPATAPDLTDLPLLGPLLRWRHARSVLSLPLLALAGVMVVDGFAGPQQAPRNLATVLTWTHYRGFVVLALLAVGNLFCMACPFMLPRNLVRRFVRPRRLWPRPLRNKWPAVGVLVAFLFLYEWLDLWASPFLTALTILAYFAGVVAVDALFRGAPFCKYICPIGQFNFLASIASPTEIKVRDPQTCRACATKDCIRGRGNLRGCELWLFQERKVGNLDCTFCLDCVHACPYGNVGLVARWPIAEAWEDRVRSGIGRLSRRPDLGFLALVFVFGSLLNAFGMVSPVYAVERWLAEAMGVRWEWPVLGILFAGGLVVEPLLLVGLTGWASRRLSGAQEALLPHTLRYVYALIPFGFGMWTAHYGFHFFTGLLTVVPAVQEWAMDLFGAPVLGMPHRAMGPVLPQEALFALEVGLLILGWLATLLVLAQQARRDPSPRPWGGFLAWAVLAVLLLYSALWLLSQPMEMRGTFLG